MKKIIMLGTSDALSHRPSEPAYYIEDCQICSKSWRVCDQIETLGTDMLPNVNDHATKLTLFDKDFHVPWLPILTRKKKGQSIVSLLCFHEALELEFLIQ